MHISQLKNQIPQLIERSSYPYISVYKYDHVAHIYILRSHMRRYKTKNLPTNRTSLSCPKTAQRCTSVGKIIFKPAALRRGLPKERS